MRIELNSCNWMKRANKSLITSFSGCFTEVHTGYCCLPLKSSGVQKSCMQFEITETNM